MAVQRRHQDDPVAPAISAREILMAWVVAGLIALGVMVVAPDGARHDPSPVANTVVAGLAEARALDGFENAADRAATVAGTDDGTVPADRPVVRPPAAIAHAASPHVRLCHWLAGPAPDAGRGS
jgi:hypothetical protein